MSLKEAKNNIFAQCWSTDHYSALLWKAFSRDGQGVRIKTRVGKMYDSLPKEIGDEFEVQKTISPVEYLSENKIKKHLKDLISKDGISLKSAMKMFFKKREAYSAEKEVRVIIPFDKKNHSPDLKKEGAKRFLEYDLDPK